MRNFILIGLFIGLLSGCASRNPGSRESQYAYRDSLRRKQSDSILLNYNRQMKTGHRTKIRQVSFSDPDSLGIQYVKSMALLFEEWTGEDSVEISMGRITASELHRDISGRGEEKVIVKEKRYTAGRIIVLSVIVILLLFLLIGRCKNKSKK